MNGIIHLRLPLLRRSVRWEVSAIPGLHVEEQQVPMAEGACDVDGEDADDQGGDGE